MIKKNIKYNLKLNKNRIIVIILFLLLIVYLCCYYKSKVNVPNVSSTFDFDSVANNKPDISANDSLLKKKLTLQKEIINNTIKNNRIKKVNKTNYKQNLLVNTKKSKLITPRVISKNSVQIDSTKNIYTKNLIWKSVKDAESYEIIIEGIKSSSIFGDQHKKLVSTTLLDSIYRIDPQFFKDFDKYRWKIRSKNSYSTSKFSPYYYFQLNEKENLISEEDIDEIVMRLKYDGFIDEMIVTKFQNGKVLLPLTEIFSLLQLDHKIDYKNKTFSGNRHDKLHEKFKLNYQGKELRFNNTVEKISKENFVTSDLELFVASSLFEKMTAMKVKIDMKRLTVSLSSDFIIPVVQRKINEKKLSIYNSKLKENQYPLLFNRERKYLSGGFLDYSASAHIINGKPSTYYLSTGLAAELFGGDLQVSSQQSFYNNNLSFNEIKYRWRYAILKNDYISNITVGHKSLQGLISYQSQGVRISNEPIEPRKVIGCYEITEKAKPGWKIEVYHNNQLIDIVNADEKGNYNFQIPFSYGTTMLELHETGLNGEYNIKNKMYQIPIEQVPEGKLDYSIDFGKLDNTDEYLLQSNTKYGINDWLTTKIGADVFTSNLENSSIYSTTTVRFLDKFIGNLIIAPNAYHELSVNSLFSDLASFNVSAKLYENNEKINPSNLKNELEGSIFLPLKVNNNIMSFLIRGRVADYSNSKRTNFSLRTFYSFMNFSPSLELDYFNVSNKYSDLEAMYLNFRLNYNLNISSDIFVGNIFDARLNYDVLNSNVESMNFSISTTVLKKIRVQLTHTRNLQSQYSDTQLRFVYDLSFLRSNTNISRNSVTQSVLGSINYNEHLNEVNFYNRGMLGRSAASFKFFVDENMNKEYDEGEKLIPDMDIQINSIGSKQRVNNGNIIVNDLESYSRYNVKLIDKNNKSPLWSTEQEKFSFISDPHQFKEILIPFYEVGEVMGLVQKKSLGNLLPISGLTIHLINEESNEDIVLKTMSDGSFYFYGIKPGAYNIYVDEEQLKRLNLQSSPQSYNGTIRSISVEEEFTEYNFILE